jgi:hypothetical protein
MANMAAPGGTDATSTGRARRAATVSTSLATGVAVLTVLMSALADRVGDDPLAFAERRLPAWLTAVGLAVVGVVVAGLWATRAHHPWASIGLAVATAGSLLPLWAAWSWLPGVVRAGMLAATPFVVVGVAQVGLGWAGPGSRHASAAMRLVFALVIGGALVYLLGYNPFADPGCARTCADVTPLLGGLISTRSAMTIAGLLTLVAAFLAVVVVLRENDRRTPRQIVGAVLVALGVQVVSPIVALRR